MSKRTLLAAAGLLLGLYNTPLLAADLGEASKAFENKDYSAALDALEPLGKEGNPDALSMLGQMYENGWGVDKDLERAASLFKRGANQGHLESVNGLRRIKNTEYQKELKSIRLSAEAGDAHAQNRLGEMYEFGYGLERDPNQAYDWYLRAAEQNLVAAEHNIGRCYNFGTGVAQDFVQAELWYRKAAKQGHMDAMFFLGTLYSNNHGQDQSINTNVMAYAWMHNSAQLGNATAAAIEKRLLMKLDESQTQAAKNLAEEYLDQYVRPFK
ncbi:tetratricopeptide repeat protein [Marinobacterium rhizophilum]|uniref:Sel1 repeat family protein n=1 Tax=Marinobacterium rhizophilum TaxID=420402 RepID=A0ABY5HJE8_9GAMM|nr:tetratricopeptide repeat protein [Marinobacterium rhizophilum]UTW11703.1 sel1 repeat family protein [Marinobacterium rhizophilum]